MHKGAPLIVGGSEAVEAGGGGGGVWAVGNAGTGAARCCLS